LTKHSEVTDAGDVTDLPKVQHYKYVQKSGWER